MDYCTQCHCSTDLDLALQLKMLMNVKAGIPLVTISMV